MKVEVSVAEVVQIFKEIQEQPEKILEMVRADMLGYPPKDEQVK